MMAQCRTGRMLSAGMHSTDAALRSTGSHQHRRDMAQLILPPWPMLPWMEKDFKSKARHDSTPGQSRAAKLKTGPSQTEFRCTPNRKHCRIAHGSESREGLRDASHQATIYLWIAWGFFSPQDTITAWFPGSTFSTSSSGHDRLWRCKELRRPRYKTRPPMRDNNRTRGRLSMSAFSHKNVGTLVSVFLYLDALMLKQRNWWQFLRGPKGPLHQIRWLKLKNLMANMRKRGLKNPPTRLSFIWCSSDIHGVFRSAYSITWTRASL